MWVFSDIAIIWERQTVFADRDSSCFGQQHSIRYTTGLAYTQTTPKAKYIILVLVSSRPSRAAVDLPVSRHALVYSSNVSFHVNVVETRHPDPLCTSPRTLPPAFCPHPPLTPVRKCSTHLLYLSALALTLHILPYYPSLTVGSASSVSSSYQPPTHLQTRNVY